jgi:putative PIN family toxin of toxin-antitoxin system
MLKVIIDTNVLVSSLIQRSYPFLIVQFLINSRKSKICISTNLLDEYKDVLSREKFMKYPLFILNAKDLLFDLEEKGEKYHPTVTLDILEDKSDNKFLELAETCDADYLITGNVKHFPMKEYKKTKIVSPKEFWELEVI